ncbi:MAG: GNAT family N-acetyltransferase [Candidatus Hodarchaeota archaeon]
MYKGKLTRLRRLEKKDVEIILQYFNNYELHRNLGAPPLPVSQEDEVKFIEGVNAAFNQRSQFTFGIEELEADSLIGTVSLFDMDWVNRVTEIGISIFNPKYWGKGYGSDAMIVLLDFAFSVLDLHNVSLRVNEFNQRAIKAYEKIGFTHQGKIRESQYIDGKRHDVLLMDMLKSEFLDKHGVLPKGTGR